MALLSASSVENLMAVALPVLMRDTFTSERPMALARSFERIYFRKADGACEVFRTHLPVREHAVESEYEALLGV